MDCCSGETQQGGAVLDCLQVIGREGGAIEILQATRDFRVPERSIRVGGASMRPAPGSFSPAYSFRTILDEACLPAVILKDDRAQEVPGPSVREEFVLPRPGGKGRGLLHPPL